MIRYASIITANKQSPAAKARLSRVATVYLGGLVKIQVDTMPPKLLQGEIDWHHKVEVVDVGTYEKTKARAMAVARR